MKKVNIIHKICICNFYDHNLTWCINIHVFKKSKIELKNNFLLKVETIIIVYFKNSLTVKRYGIRNKGKLFEYKIRD